MSEQPVVFLSHSIAAADQPILTRLDEEFRSLGVEVYLAEREFSATTSTAKIRAAIASSQVVVVLLTVSGSASAWVNTEVGIAIEQGKPIVPLVEEGVEPPGPIRERDQIRFNRDRLEEAVARVWQFIKNIRERASQTESSEWDAFATGVAVGALLTLVVVLIIVAVASRK